MILKKKIAVYKAIGIRNSPFFKYLNKINIKYLKLILRKILSCPYINNKDKIILKITLVLKYFFYIILFWITISNKFRLFYLKIIILINNIIK